QLSRFVGREQAIAELRRLLGNARLLTLTGPGGIGKTRLALALSEKVVPDYADGIWLVELASVAAPALVVTTAAAVLGIYDSGSPLLQQLAEWLRSRAMLVVLDNCEHLIQASADLAATLLQSCPNLRILATSRQPLGVSGEQVWRVPPLAVSEPHAATT